MVYFFLPCLAQKKPTDNRFLVRLWLPFLVFSFPGSLFAQSDRQISTLSETQVIERIANLEGIKTLVRGEIDLEDADSQEATKLSNPAIAYSREQTFGTGGSAEDNVTVSQEFALSGARKLRLIAGGHRAKAAELEGQTLRAHLTFQARLLFFEALHAQHRVKVVVSWLDRLSGALKILAARERSGDAAAFERALIDREMTNAKARMASEKAALARLRGSLAGLIKLDDPQFHVSGKIAGSLMPEDELPSAEILLKKLDQHPDLLALDEQVEAVKLDKRAAARGWVPSLILEGGWQSLSEDNERFHGYIVSAALTLPFLDHDQAAKRRAKAEQRVIEGQRELIVSQARGRILGLHAQASTLTKAAQTHKKQSKTSHEAIIRAIESAYRADEASVVELLDVHEIVLEDELEGLKLAHSARRARIELDHTLGRIQP